MATYMWILLSIAVNLAVVGTALVLFGRKVDRAMRRSTLLSQVQTEVQDILTELNQTTDRNIGLIENRISRLSRLIEDADRRITILDSEQEKAEKANLLHADIRERDPAKTPVQQRLFTGDDAAYRIGTDIEKYGRNSGPVAPRSVGHRNGTPGSEGGGGSRDSTKSRVTTEGEDAIEKVSPGEVRRTVLDLYRKGFDAKLIAGKIGKTLGEVELIISLEKGKV